MPAYSATESTQIQRFVNSDQEDIVVSNTCNAKTIINQRSTICALIVQ